MNATLVSLGTKEVEWSRPKHPPHIGKDILELLSSSMYVDVMSMYREYIQNSADGIDAARAAGLLQGTGRVDVQIDTSDRRILIRDNGIGLGQREFVSRLTALGGSRKRGTQARGFRGVGRLAGLAFAQELVFRSRQEGETTVHELRWNAREVRTILRTADSSKDLQEVVLSSVAAREIPAGNWPSRFFEVELRSVIRHKDDRLLTDVEVAKYLSQVAPVPFHPDFGFADQVRAIVEPHGVRLGAINIVIDGYGQVYRPHSNAITLGRASDTNFRELTSILTPGRDGEVAAVTWILHSEYKGSLPASALVDGWRFRIGDLQIGGNDILLPLFPEPRFNSWCVAETHVVDPRILPNGRRDHFEQNAYFIELQNDLASHTRDIAHRCRTSSIKRNLLRKLKEGTADIDKRLRVLKRGTLTEAAGRKLVSQVTVELKNLRRLVSRPALDAEHRTGYELRLQRLEKQLMKVSEAAGSSSPLEGFGPTQRAFLEEVFNAIYVAHADLEKAHKIIERVLSKLAKTKPDTRVSTKKKK